MTLSAFGALQQPEHRGLGQLHGGRLPAGGLRHDLERLRLEHRTYTLTSGRRYSFGCRYRLGTASNLVMYVSAADNDYVGVTGTFLGTASQGVWSAARLDFSVPPAESRSCTSEPSVGLSPGWCRSGPRPSRESRSP